MWIGRAGSSSPGYGLQSVGLPAAVLSDGSKKRKRHNKVKDGRVSGWNMARADVNSCKSVCLVVFAYISPEKMLNVGADAPGEGEEVSIGRRTLLA